MKVILKDILDAGLVAPIALILMTLVDYFDFNSLLLTIQIIGMCGMLLNLYWLVNIKKKKNKL
tara:strand:- start:605 stop:793 length:189 start_codon:yes stop_codon:yes gene_type:complete